MDDRRNGVVGGEEILMDGNEKRCDRGIMGLGFGEGVLGVVERGGVI